jgi:DnaJ homolog subfamily C member 13
MQKKLKIITDYSVLGAPNQVAGYLTQGPSKSIEVVTVPPPMDRNDPLARETD